MSDDDNWQCTPHARVRTTGLVHTPHTHTHSHTLARLEKKIFDSLHVATRFVIMADSIAEHHTVRSSDVYNNSAALVCVQFHSILCYIRVCVCVCI